MEVLNISETENYVGGAKLTLGLGIFIGSAFTFLIGIINGYSSTTCSR